MTNNTSNNQEYDAIIVGAGFAGLYQLICLRDQLGLNCLIIETGDDVIKLTLLHSLHNTDLKFILSSLIIDRNKKYTLSLSK